MSQGQSTATNTFLKCGEHKLLRDAISYSGYCDTFLRSVICLSIVCLSHSCTLLKPLTDFDAIGR